MKALDLASARADAELSQEEVAALLGVAQTTVSAWERGRMRPPVRHLVAYARICGVRPSALFVDGPVADDLRSAYDAGWADCAVAVTAAAKRQAR